MQIFWDELYYYSYLNRYFEFTISEPDFLEWRTSGKFPWEPVEIKSLPSLPKPEKQWVDRQNGDWKLVNSRREIPLFIVRYCHKKAEHENCNPWDEKCSIDPTGKTDEACFRILDDGYYYQTSRRNGGGVYVLYDRENQRCYINYSSH